MGVTLYLNEAVNAGEVNPAYADWLMTRPACVQSLALEFPLGLAARVDDGPLLYLVGYTEDDRLIMSEVNPGDDYHGALANKVYLCAAHAREAA